MTGVVRHGNCGPRAKPAAYLLLFATTLALVACGGKDLNRQEFVARAEKTCRQSIPEFAQLPDPQALSPRGRPDGTASDASLARGPVRGPSS